MLMATETRFGNQRANALGGVFKVQIIHIYHKGYIICTFLLRTHKELYILVQIYVSFFMDAALCLVTIEHVYCTMQNLLPARSNLISRGGGGGRA
jgi:hypothetical protein